MPLSIQKASIKNDCGVINIYPTRLGQFAMGKRTMKKWKELKIAHDCKIVRSENDFWLLVPIEAEINALPITNKACGGDLGIRTFLTTFSNDEIVEFKRDKMLIRKL